MSFQAYGEQGFPGQPGSAGGQSQEGDQKTTLWYVISTSFFTCNHGCGSVMSLCKGALSRLIGALLLRTRKLTWTCRMGELEPWVDESFVRTVWFNMGEQVNVKMIRDKFSG